MTIADLKLHQDKTVVLHLYDGEITTGKIDFVDTEYEDIIVDVVDTNRREKYKGPANAVYVINAADIASVEEISN